MKTRLSLVPSLVLALLPLAGCAPEEEEGTTSEDELVTAGGGKIKLWENGIVNVCIEKFDPSPSVSNEDLFNAHEQIKAAANNSWGREANIKFDFRCRKTAKRVIVRIKPVKDLYGIGGMANLGEHTINNVEMGWCAPSLRGANCTDFHADGRVNKVDANEMLRAVTIHEFGHVLGFVHEHKRVDIPRDVQLWCKAATIDERVKSDINNGFEWQGRHLTGKYDPDSIMNYCRDADGDRRADQPWSHVVDRLSAGDREGARAAYGHPKGAVIDSANASYGLNCPNNRAPDVSAHVSQACRGRAVCDYVIDHRVIGDPAVNCAKEYEVLYHCRTPINTIFTRRISVPKEASGRLIRLDCN